MKGLEILGCTRTADRVAEALSSISDTLNVELSPSAKSLFHGGEVGLVDVEHILCKIARKQQRQPTRSAVWLEHSGSKRKRTITEETKDAKTGLERRRVAR